jgi:hypothetical protein
MTAAPIPVTHVRLGNRDAAARLNGFVFGGDDACRRPPRGINPEFVSYWIREFVKPTASSTLLMRVVDVLRFYERSDVLDRLSRFLTRTGADPESFARNAYVLQAMGEVGSPEQKRFAGGFFAELLLPHPQAMSMFPLLLQTAECLAGAIDTARIGSRLEQAGDERIYSRYVANMYPRGVSVIEAKQRLMAANPEQRLHELFAIYLGESQFSTSSMGIWSARLIRDYAMHEGKAAVLSGFTEIVDGALRSTMSQRKIEFLVHRSVQAIIYLGGKISFRHEAVYDGIKSGPENFLWDD